MEDPVPEWVSSDFFTQCLQKETGNPNISVTNFIISSAAPPGNNYGSYIIRVKVEYKNDSRDNKIHSLSLIVKSELTHGPIKDISSELQQNEPSFYYRFIPKANKFIDTSFVPKSLFSPKATVTILEDLKDQGFVMADRAKQLDFDHCRLYMVAAASFHAVSVAVYRDHPELLDPIRGVNFFTHDSNMKNTFELMIKYGIKCLADATEKVESFKKYSTVLRDFVPQMWDLLVEAHKPSENLNTIKQGDPWTTNMMFKYDKEGKVNAIKIIDFQGTSYGSPINDLVFFIWSSANNDVKKHRLSELYRIYVDSLNGKLEEFRCTERLNYEQLEAELQRMIPQALIGATTLPSLFDPEPMDIGLLFSKGNNEEQVESYFKKNYTEDYCNSYLPQLLECLELNGVFEFIQNKRK